MTDNHKEAAVTEDGLTYDDFFSSLEWQAIVTNDWSLLDSNDEEGSW
jgi:hypothetical protein